MKSDYTIIKPINCDTMHDAEKLKNILSSIEVVKGYTIKNVAFDYIDNQNVIKITFTKNCGFMF